MTANDQKPCSRSAFFEKHALIASKIERLGFETTHEALGESVALGHTYFSQDSRWSSQFNGLENIHYWNSTGPLVNLLMNFPYKMN